MPRTRVNTKKAEKAGTPGPKRKGTPPTPPADMAKRAQTMYGLALHAATHDQQMASMTKAFPGITEEAVRKLRADMDRLILESTGDTPALKKAKAELRILTSISTARAKGAFSAVASLEAEYAKIVGIHAPVRVHHQHEVSESFRAAFQVAVQQLTSEQARGLLDGETVPIGFSGGGAVIDVEGEPNDGV
jgi:hypothetical protein